MISDLQLLFALRVSMTREVAAGDWPDARQGENSITATLAGVDTDVWNEAYIAKIPLPAAADVTVSLSDFETLLFEENVALTKVHGIALKVTPTVPADTDVELLLSPGATDPLQWFLGSGITMLANQVMFLMDAVTGAGQDVDGTQHELRFQNLGSDDGTVTVIIIGER